MVQLCAAIGFWWSSDFAQAADQPAAPPPTRVVTAYALTSAMNDEYRDPRDWRLLGSDDEGKSWTVLDVRQSQEFTGRSERKVFPVGQPKPCHLYRLHLDNCPPDTTYQLAELELMGPAIGVTNQSELHWVVTASRAPPLMGPAENAFDGDPTTRWVDFGSAQEGGVWIQCQYTAEREVTLTNLHQVMLLSRRLALGERLLARAPQILSNLIAGAKQPLRTLRGYALTSANDSPERDPRDWRLLGSNDGGKTWNALDVRHGETFPTRFLRRMFLLTNQTACAIYRLQIDSIRVPSGAFPANSVQIAELEPLCVSATNEARYSIAVSTQGENPPMETGDKAFDGDSKTKWLDFGEVNDKKKSSWIQWQYLPAEETAVISVNRLRAASGHALPPMRLDVEGVAVSSAPSAKALTLLDQTGCESFKLASSNVAVLPGARVRLAGQLRLDGQIPELLDPVLIDRGPVVDEANLEKSGLGEREPFAWGTAAGKATFVSEDSTHIDVDLTKENQSAHTVARILNPTGVHIPMLRNCRLEVQGVLERVRNAVGQAALRTVWVPSIERVKLAPLSDEEWHQWPDYPMERLKSPALSILPGSPVRVQGVVRERQGKILRLEHEASQLIIHCSEPAALTPGTTAEVVGFLDQEDGQPVLQMAQVHAGISEASPLRPVKPEAAGPLTEIRKVREAIGRDPSAKVPVKLQGVVTAIDLNLFDFYLQNGSESILCVNQFGAGLSPFLDQEGLYVELDGVAYRDPVLVSVHPTAFVRILGQGQMPEAVHHSRDYLMTGRDDGHWVELEGVVSNVEEQRLTLLMEGGEVMVWINRMSHQTKDRLLGGVVRVRGVCSPVVNNRNQQLGLRLLVPSSEFIEILVAAPPDPFSLPQVPINHIMESGARSGGVVSPMVRTEGIVTYQQPGLFFVQNGSDGLRVYPRQPVAIDLGDRVQVVGLAEPDGFSPKLVQALVRKVGQENLPAAPSLNLLEIELSSQDATRVKIKADVLGQSARESVHILELQDRLTKKSFYAFIPFGREPFPPLANGTGVMLEGVFKAKAGSVTDYNELIRSFEIYVNTPGDIKILERPPWWTTRFTLWTLGGMLAVLLLALAWVGLLRDQVQKRTRELHEEIADHERAEAKLQAEVLERQRMEKEVAKTHRKLLEVSRQAGMAEVATSVLHNVGNVLNSVNVSAHLVSERIRKSKSASLGRVAVLLREHAGNLAGFLTEDTRGRQLPTYLTELSEHLIQEQMSVLGEIQSLETNIDHIKEIVIRQQSYATIGGVLEQVKVTDLVEDALRMNAASLARHQVKVLRHFDQDLPQIMVEKHKVLQILINLIENAKKACADSGRQDGQLTVRVARNEDHLEIEVADNGVGIPKENLTRIFSHGFTTRKNGHGFGLHSGALAARELGGTLSVQSDGTGTGAAFTLTLPLAPVANARTP